MIRMNRKVAVLTLAAPTLVALAGLVALPGCGGDRLPPKSLVDAREEFTRANVKDFGHGDLRDIFAGIDAVLKKYPVEPKRLGVTGWSYGGFMVMWAVTQTDRFAAAVAGAGICNWQSTLGYDADSISYAEHISHVENRESVTLR